MNRSIARLLTLAAALLALAACAPAAYAEAPANDNIAAAQEITGEGTINVDTGDSTIEAHEYYNSLGNSVWFKWTAPTTAEVAFDTCSTDIPAGASPFFYDSFLSVSTANDPNDIRVDNLAHIGEGDDDCGVLSYARFAAVQGTTYWIQLMTWYGPPATPYKLRMHTVQPGLINLAPPVVGYFGPPMAGDFVMATSGVWESLNPVSYSYQWKLCDADGTNCANIDGATSDTHNTNGETGHSYVVAVTATGDDGTITVESPPSSTVLDAPTNGFFAAATDLGSGASASTDGYNWFVSGGLEPGEPAAAAPTIQDTVWYKWTAPANGSVTVDTCDQSPFEPAPAGSSLAIYTGDSLATLATVGHDDGGCAAPSSGSKVTFEAVAGTRYWIQVAERVYYDTHFSTSYHLKIGLTLPPAPEPANPVAIDPFPAAALGKSLGTVKPSRKGVAALKKLKLVCGASATGPCTGTLTIKTKKTKVKGKRIASVSQKFKLTIKPGKTLDAKFKLSKKLVSALKKAKKLKASVTIKAGAPGFAVKTLRTGVTFKR
jgi:hypothetical protein